MRKESLEFLKELINASSPSGFEEHASSIWCKYLKDDFEVSGDIYGNSTAVLNKGSNPKIMLSGHIDEVGFMVNYINEDGFVYISPIGGVDPTILPAQRVIIYNRNGPILGVIGQKPIHLSDGEDDGEIRVHNLFIDIGASSKEDALKFISIGDPITFESKFDYLLNNIVVGRGFDNRMGAWCIAEALRILKENNKCSAEISALASIQEENGYYGAILGVKKIKPNVALIVDAEHSTDVPNILKERHGDIKLGNGPVITIGSVIHKKINNMLLDIAEYNRIPVQIQIGPRYTGTDADAIFTERVPSVIVGVPNRYMHSPVELIDINDLENAVDLIVAWCESLNDFDFNLEE